MEKKGLISTYFVLTQFLRDFQICYNYRYYRIPGIVIAAGANAKSLQDMP